MPPIQSSASTNFSQADLSIRISQSGLLSASRQYAHSVAAVRVRPRTTPVKVRHVRVAPCCGRLHGRDELHRRRVRVHQPGSCGYCCSLGSVDYLLITRRAAPDRHSSPSRELRMDPERAGHA